MKTARNRRECNEHVVEKQHLKLNDLKEEAKAHGLGNQYLFKDNIPKSPHPEFVVSHVKHDTDGKGLRAISEDNGFKAPFKDKSSGLDLLWWSLSVGPDEITSAERRLLKETYPDQMKEEKPLPDQMEEEKPLPDQMEEEKPLPDQMKEEPLPDQMEEEKPLPDQMEEEKPLPDQMEEEKPLPDQKQQGFLEKFTTSPAFLKSSRLGSYRFTFPLEELLEAYSKQFCSGARPVMRVFKTILYKQEVMYVVLVHSPDQEQFSDYPLLTDHPDAVCTYRDGCFIWRPEAMSETHRYELIVGPDQMKAQKLSRRHEFYVWDNVSIALHVEDKVLDFDAGRLRDNLKFCHEGYPSIILQNKFDNFQGAEQLVNNLWPDRPSPLEKDE